MAAVGQLRRARAMAEPGQAPVSRPDRCSRSRWWHGWHVVMALLGLGLVLVVPFAAWRVSSHVQAMAVASVASVAVGPEAGSSSASLTAMRPATGPPCAAPDTLIAALAPAAELDVDLHVLDIPLSWLVSGPAAAAQARLTDTVLSAQVLPALACRLRERATALRAGASALASPDQGYSRLREGQLAHVSAVLAYEDQVDAYEFLARARHSVSDPAPTGAAAHDRVATFEQLLQELYGRRLQVSPHSLLARSLADAQSEAVPWPTDHGSRSAVSRELADGLAPLGAVLSRALGLEVQAGPAWWRRLEEGSIELADLQALLRWLGWIQSRWLPFDEGHSPCTNDAAAFGALFDTLVRRHHYPPSLASTLQALSNDTCTTPARMALKDMTLPPERAFIRGPAGHEQVDGALGQEMAGLNALTQLSFLSHSPDTLEALLCVQPSAGWQGADVVRALTMVHEYQSFAASHGLPAWHQDKSRRPAYDRLARRQLQRNLHERLNAAQIRPVAAPPVSAGLTPATEEQVAARSQSFAQAADHLLALHAVLTQMQMTDSARELNRCVRAQAVDGLQQLRGLARRSRLYQPDISVLKVVNSAAGLPSRTGSTGDVQDYLAQQLARTRVLTKHAEPYLQLLRNSQTVDSQQGNTSDAALFWGETVGELSRYANSSDHAGAVGRLEGLLRSLGRGPARDHCVARPETKTASDAGHSLFAERLRAWQVQLDLRCPNKANDSYLALARRFNLELSGRYPFAAMSAADAPLDIVQRFFIDYAEMAVPLTNTMRASKADHAAVALDFLARLDKVAAFLRGNLAAGEAPEPVTLGPLVRALPGTSSGRDQVVSWSLRSGSDTITDSGVSPREELDWPFGQALALDLVWASTSVWRPVQGPGDPVVEGRKATFGQGGDWALLRLLESHAPRRRAAVAGLDAPRQPLAFTVSVMHQTDRRLAQARLDLDLELRSTDPVTRALVPVTWPGPFVRAAPNP
jgi:type VI secretion system protein ImpL